MWIFYGNYCLIKWNSILLLQIFAGKNCNEIAIGPVSIRTLNRYSRNVHNWHFHFTATESVLINTKRSICQRLAEMISEKSGQQWKKKKRTSSVYVSIYWLNTICVSSNEYPRAIIMTFHIYVRSLQLTCLLVCRVAIIIICNNNNKFGSIDSGTRWQIKRKSTSGSCAAYARNYSSVLREIVAYCQYIYVNK